MSGIFDQIINYSPPLIVSGTVNYKGTWNASTNNPTLNDPPATSTKGDYYVVSTAGTQFTISFAVGDWIISSGTAWEKVDLTDAVSSVFGRTGAVVGVSTDYSSVGLTNTAIGASSPSTGAFTTVTASSTIAATGAVTGSNLSGTNTGDQTTITGNAGSATVLQTPRAIYGNNFDGSAALTQIIASTYGGTGNGFAKFSGPASSEKTFTLPNASSTLLYEGGTIGATTANTGAFTTLALSDKITATKSGSNADYDVLTARNANVGNDTSTRILLGQDTSAVAGFVQMTGSNNASYPNVFRLGTNISGTSVAVVVNTSTIGTFSSTGLAVTGALSATGKVTSTNGGVGFEVNYGGTGAGFSIVRTGASASTFTMLNSGGEIIHEYNSVGYGFNISTARVASISSTGLAVTGTLSATGNITINATDPYLTLNRAGTTNYSGILFKTAGATTGGWEVYGSNAATQSLSIYSYAAASAIGIFSTTGLAVTGALSCTGALSKGSGSFRIEHPLPEKSATHQLVHSFIEGPQADLIYRGKVVLVDGKASVNIDAASTMTEGTFEVLCRDVQCFTTNESGWTAVRGKVTGNILTIEAKDADCTDEISWMVIGERQDPHMMETDWTDDNGKVIVEPLKPVIESSN